MKIIYLSHNQINKYKWDNCIRQSLNGIVYAFSWYLDKSCEDWEALIHGDYEIVMPLTNNRKYRLDMLIQPPFSQQLGVFSTRRLNSDTVNSFIEAIPQKFKYINLNLNTFNNYTSEEYIISQNQTYELDLIEPYAKIAAKYSTNTSRNLKKAEKNNVQIVNNISATELLNIKNENSAINFTKYYPVAQKIISAAFIKHIGQVYGAYDKKNTLCAAAFFITSHHKSIYLIGASSPEGKKIGAMTLIFDRFIHNNAEKNLTLDFEGSNIESVARFFKGFGAKRCLYTNLKKNNLPWLIKIFKRH